MNDDRDDALHPSLALVAYASSLLTGRRVAVVGDCSRGLAERAATVSQRQVHAYDPAPERVAAAIATHRGGNAPVSFAPLDEARSAHHSAFDVVIIDEVDATSGPPLLDVARSLLAPHGVLIAATLNPETAPEGPEHLGYYDFYDLVADRFDEVHMLGLAPFVGFTMAEFALEGEPAVTIDTSLLHRTEEPRSFVALASSRAVDDLDPYTVVQMPLASILEALAGEEPHPASTTARLAEVQLKVSMQQSELDRMRERERQARAVAEEQQRAATSLSARLAELSTEHERRHRRDADRIAALEREVTDREEQARAARDEVKRLAQARQSQSRDQDRSLEDRERALRKLREQLAEAERKLEDAARDAQQAERRAEKASSRAREDRDRAVAGLEKRLRDAQEELDRLRRRDKSREKKLQELEDVARRADDELATRLEEQAEAHQEELDAMLDRIAELEGEQGESSEVDAGEEGGLNAFQAEELRRALRDARLEAERARKAAQRGREAEEKLTALEKRLAAATSSAQTDDDGVGAREIRYLEGKLVDRGQRVAVLERQLREARRVGRELVRKVGQATDTRGDEARLRALTERCSKCEADLRAAQWTIAALEEQASQAQSDEPASQVLEEALRRARAEVADLRRALEERADGS